MVLVFWFFTYFSSSRNLVNLCKRFPCLTHNWLYCASFSYHARTTLTVDGCRYSMYCRSFQKKFKQLLQPWRLNYMILALNESMKIFLARYIASVCSTEPAWLAYIRAGTLLARQFWWNYMILCIWPKNFFIN